VSPRAALYQAARVAKARGVDVARVTALIEANTEGPQWGVFGEARVNVLALNLGLDRAQ
jgi:K+-transporting ATPase ATPase C chain